MATWKNLDTLSSYDKLSGLKNHVDIATAMSGEQGGERVKNYRLQWLQVYSTITQQKK